MNGQPWPDDELDRFIAAYERGVTEPELLKMFPNRTAGSFRGRVIALQLKRPLRVGALILKPDHPAVVEGRTLFPGRVRDAGDAPALLTPGQWQRKLGGRVEKGAWRGMPIYALTLEERVTCPASCFHFRSCMGNSMQMAWRNRHGPALIEGLRVELARLQRKHPTGFVVRLHILGDFYSVEYARAWKLWLMRFPALRVFGYTAWPPTSAIGKVIGEISAALWQRFAIRWSSERPGPTRAITLWEWPANFDRFKSDLNPEESAKIIVCPAELAKTKGCGTCALCWSPAARDATIAFIAHGRKPGRTRAGHRDHIAITLSRGELSAAWAQHGSLRRAAAALGISLGKLQRGLRREAAP